MRSDVNAVRFCLLVQVLGVSGSGSDVGVTSSLTRVKHRSKSNAPQRQQTQGSAAAHRRQAHLVGAGGKLESGCVLEVPAAME